MKVIVKYISFLIFLNNLFSECKSLDAVCTESLTSLSVTWIPFTDSESQIVEYVAYMILNVPYSNYYCIS